MILVELEFSWAEAGTGRAADPRVWEHAQRANPMSNNWYREGIPIDNWESVLSNLSTNRCKERLSHDGYGEAGVQNAELLRDC